MSAPRHVRDHLIAYACGIFVVSVLVTATIILLLVAA